MSSNETIGGLTSYIKGIRAGESWALESGDELVVIPRSQVRMQRRSRMRSALELLLGPAFGRLRGLYRSAGERA